MKTKEKIIKFMELKQAKIHSLYQKKDIVNIPFFTAEDHAIIEKWTEKKAKEVWNIMKQNIKDIPYECIGLISEVCPFCVYHNLDCNKCNYAKNHGEECEDLNSLCEKIMENIYLITNKNHAHFLDKEFYNSIINKAQAMK